jgi:putative peptidoglycan lipid II flippase
VASFANTILLLFFLAKSKNIDVSSISKGLFVYLIKLCIFSAIAAVPIIFVLPKLNEIFADYGRFIKYGVPLFSTVAIFALCGILLLLITNDEIIVLIKNRLRRKNS